MRTPLAKDDGDRLPALDLRDDIEVAIKGHRCRVDNEEALQQINWSLNRIFEDQADIESTNAEAIELLRRMRSAYDRFARAWDDVSADSAAGRLLFRVTRSIAGRHKQLFALDRSLHDPTIVRLMAKATPAELRKVVTRLAPGPSPVAEAHPGIETLIASVMYAVTAQGSTATKRKPVSKKQMREIVSELLALIEIRVEPQSLARHFKRAAITNAS